MHYFSYPIFLILPRGVSPAALKGSHRTPSIATTWEVCADDAHIAVDRKSILPGHLQWPIRFL